MKNAENNYNENITTFRNSGLFKNLDECCIEYIYEYLKPSEKEYSRNQIIISQGETVSQLGIIKKGTVLNTKYHHTGEARILRLYKRFETLFIEPLNTPFKTSPGTISGQSECSILFFKYDRLLSINKPDSMIREIIFLNIRELLGNELIRLMYKIDVLSERKLKDRILTYLSIIREKKGCNSFDIGMNQEEFAQYLCVNRSVLSKELNLLRRKGLIDYKKSEFKLY